MASAFDTDFQLDTHKKKPSLVVNTEKSSGSASLATPKSPKKKICQPSQPDWRCIQCGVNEKQTPLKRKGPDGKRSICNACYVRGRVRVERAERGSARPVITPGSIVAPLRPGMVKISLGAANFKSQNTTYLPSTPISAGYIPMNQDIFNEQQFLPELLSPYPQNSPFKTEMSPYTPGYQFDPNAPVSYDTGVQQPAPWDQQNYYYPYYESYNSPVYNSPDFEYQQNRQFHYYPEQQPTKISGQYDEEFKGNEFVNEEFI